MFINRCKKIIFFKPKKTNQYYYVQFKDDIVRFSFPIEFTIIYPTKLNSETLAEKWPQGWPRLLLRVISEDIWQRFYVDGYSSMELPIQPGTHCFEINCWRLINPYSNLSAFKEMFLGQAVDLLTFESAGIRKIDSKEWV